MTPEDGEDDLDETYYGFYPFPAGGVQMGFVNTMSYVSNEMRVRLVYSRNGKNWHHLNKRQPFLAPRGEGHWDAFMVTITHNPIRVGDELFIYHGGASNHHDWWILGDREGLDVPEVTDPDGVNYALGLAKLRVDGFVSLDAGPTRCSMGSMRWEPPSALISSAPWAIATAWSSASGWVWCSA